MEHEKLVSLLETMGAKVDKGSFSKKMEDPTYVEKVRGLLAKGGATVPDSASFAKKYGTQKPLVDQFKMDIKVPGMRGAASEVSRDATSAIRSKATDDRSKKRKAIALAASNLDDKEFAQYVKSMAGDKRPEVYAREMAGGETSALGKIGLIAGDIAGGVGYVPATIANYLTNVMAAGKSGEDVGDLMLNDNLTREGQNLKGIVSDEIDPVGNVQKIKDAGSAIINDLPGVLKGVAETITSPQDMGMTMLTAGAGLGLGATARGKKIAQAVSLMSKKKKAALLAGSAVPEATAMPLMYKGELDAGQSVASLPASMAMMGAAHGLTKLAPSNNLGDHRFGRLTREQPAIDQTMRNKAREEMQAAAPVNEVQSDPLDNPKVRDTFDLVRKLREKSTNGTVTPAVAEAKIREILTANPEAAHTLSRSEHGQYLPTDIVESASKHETAADYARDQRLEAELSKMVEPPAPKKSDIAAQEKVAKLDSKADATADAFSKGIDVSASTKKLAENIANYKKNPESPYGKYLDEIYGISKKDPNTSVEDWMSAAHNDAMGYMRKASKEAGSEYRSGTEGARRTDNLMGRQMAAEEHGKGLDPLSDDPALGMTPDEVRQIIHAGDVPKELEPVWNRIVDLGIDPAKDMQPGYLEAKLKMAKLAKKEAEQAAKEAAKEAGKAKKAKPQKGQAQGQSKRKTQPSTETPSTEAPKSVSPSTESPSTASEPSVKKLRSKKKKLPS